mmetsp:Transcript_106773/g.194222  ORF Transcript_106773/g.194222 Transcript_106773/m.194222 type:complete len:103 (-) Transcript_106773:338-646(-)
MRTLRTPRATGMWAMKELGSSLSSFISRATTNVQVQIITAKAAQETPRSFQPPSIIHEIIVPIDRDDLAGRVIGVEAPAPPPDGCGFSEPSTASVLRSLGSS